MANHVAKTAERKPGSYSEELATVCDLSRVGTKLMDEILATTDVGEAWGVGRQISTQLIDAGVQTVLDFVRLPGDLVRSRWGVVLERTWRELRGEACIELSDLPPPKKQIACTRSFGNPVTDLKQLEEAISEFTSRAAEKLRRQQYLAGQVLVFARTSPFRDGPRYSRSVVVPLRRPTADSRELTGSALLGLRSIFQPGYQLAKAGLMLLDLVPNGMSQSELDLDDAVSEQRDRSKLMQALDQVNERFGRRTLLLGSAGIDSGEQSWGMRQLRRTPRYTTCWDEVPIARA